MTVTAPPPSLTRDDLAPGVKLRLPDNTIVTIDAVIDHPSGVVTMLAGVGYMSLGLLGLIGAQVFEPDPIAVANAEESDFFRLHEWVNDAGLGIENETREEEGAWV